MKIVFVGSNPSNLGPESPAIKVLTKWMQELGCLEIADFTNVSLKPTPNNRPLKKSEYELARLWLTLSDYDKVIALGNTAEDALTRVKIEHFKLPHPSPKNRKLNDKKAIQEVLSECKEYLTC